VQFDDARSALDEGGIAHIGDIDGGRSMTTITLIEAKSKLAELIHQLKPGDEVVITLDQQPVAKLVGQFPPARQPRRPGSAKGTLVIQQDDDGHLTDFAEHMP
jgi:antitoxin (DNA-binding transcriptional repressor) of toxin-antitoxin stability system